MWLGAAFPPSSPQSVLADENGKLDTSRRVLAGLGAGVTEAMVIVTPFEVVKIRLQSQVGTDKSKLKYSGPVDAAIKTIRQEVISKAMVFVHAHRLS